MGHGLRCCHANAVETAEHLTKLQKEADEAHLKCHSLSGQLDTAKCTTNGLRTQVQELTERVGVLKSEKVCVLW